MGYTADKNVTLALTHFPFLQLNQLFLQYFQCFSYFSHLAILHKWKQLSEVIHNSRNTAHQDHTHFFMSFKEIDWKLYCNHQSFVLMNMCHIVTTQYWATTAGVCQCFHHKILLLSWFHELAIKLDLVLIKRRLFSKER